MPRLSRVSEAAARIGCHPDTIRRAIHAGHLLALRLTPTATFRIDEETIDRMLVAGGTRRGKSRLAVLGATGGIRLPPPSPRTTSSETTEKP